MNKNKDLFNNTDFGNMERFIDQSQECLYYLKEKKKWIYFDGRHWSTHKSEKMLSNYIEKTILSIYNEIDSTKDTSKCQSLAKHAISSESHGRINAMVNLAIPRLSKELTDFDQDTMHLNVQNGTIDLKTGELKKHDKNDFISKLIPIQYEPEAQCPKWLDFLHLIMNNNSEMVDYLQRVVGYCLTGHTGERCLFILYGEGRNGKSTFTENVGYLLNDYATHTPAETLLQKKFGEGIASDLARLKGARFVHASESAYNRQLNEARIKALTGDKDTITARFLFNNEFSYIPTFKVFLHTNHKPNITGTDEAIWDRIRLIPFTVRIPDDKVKYREDIDEVFKEERPGILAWAIEGCRNWQEEGLKSPLVVSKATGEYRDESDPVKEFIEEMCTVDPTSTVPKSDLYKAYEKYCFVNGDGDHLKNKDFNKQIKNRGFDTDRESTGEKRTIWKGISLNRENKYNLDLKVVK